MKNKLEQISLDHEAIISIQEKIIRAHEETIKKEKLISSLLYDRYSDVMVDNIAWRLSYEKSHIKWIKMGVYVRDRAAYMRAYMKKKRANGEIKHWRVYLKEKTMKGNKKHGEKKNTKDKGGTKSK